MDIQENISQLEQFRLELYGSFDHRADALMELIDASSSSSNARSVAELSLSPLFWREYSSVYDAIAQLFQPSKAERRNEERRAWEQRWVRLIGRYLPEPQRRRFWLFGTDVVSIPRLFAESLQDRTFVYRPNTVLKGNKPVTIGHQYSVQVFFPEKVKVGDPPWVVPTLVRRVSSQEKATVVGAEQIAVSMKDESLPFHGELCVHVGDSAYSVVPFLGSVVKHENLVNVLRVRSNRVFYRQPPAMEGTRSRGHPRWYGERFALKDPSTWGQADVVEETHFVTRKGCIYQVRLEGWRDLLMRGKRHLPMYRHPFTLIQVQVLDEQGRSVFKHAMWLMAIGKRRNELSLVDNQQAYSQRFDQEHFFRFGKQRLLMASYQTPDVEHEENWLQMVALADVQLWLARDLAESLPRPWERYLPETEGQTASPSTVQRDFERIIRQLGTPANPPKPRGNSPGRAKGERQPPRERQPVVKKGPKRRKKTSKLA